MSGYLQAARVQSHISICHLWISMTRHDMHMFERNFGKNKTQVSEWLGCSGAVAQ